MQIWFKERVKYHFSILVTTGLPPNDAAVQAMEIVRAEQSAVAATDIAAAAATAAAAAAAATAAAVQDEGAAKFGPLCLGLAGPYKSICLTGEARKGKKLLVLDVDHTFCTHTTIPPFSSPFGRTWMGAAALP